MPARRSSGQPAAVIAAAAAASPERDSRTSFAVRTAACLLISCSAARASGEVGATVSAFSDDRFRGYSLSDSRPVAILDFAYDGPTGLYADASATGVLERGADPEPLGLQLTGGYAKRLESGTTLDLGVTHSRYVHYSAGGQGSSYTELYAGLSRGGVSSRIFLSPHYFVPGLWTAYGEVDASISPARHWGIDAHAGMLVPIRTPSTAGRYRAGFDWRIGATRQIGRLSLRAAWSEGVRGRGYSRGRVQSSHALVVGATWAL